MDEKDFDTLEQRLEIRQRFTLAHEIIHTLFFNSLSSPPTPLKETPPLRVLEFMSQLGARILLVPGHLLRKSIGDRFINADSILQLSKEFQVSAEVMVRRIDKLERLRRLQLAVVVAESESENADAKIRAVCYHPTLRPILARPKLFTNLRAWCGDYLDDKFWTEASWERSVRKDAETIRLRKVVLSNERHTFLLEIEHVSSHAVVSR